MIEKPKKVTPMMKQFLELKNQYSDCILLFRAGDFYETFYDDAKIASKVLGITLTKRGETPMAGVPFHSINPYIKKLIQTNYKVAMCEQLEDPKLAKGLVKRGVTRVISPGTIIEDEYLSSSENNFILAVYSIKNKFDFGISIVDISTGEFLTMEVDSLDDFKSIVKKYSPTEIILNESSFTSKLKSYIINSGIYYNFLSDIRFNKNYSNEILKKQFNDSSSNLGFDGKKFSLISSGALLFYIYKLQKLELKHINKIKFLNLKSNMFLDSISLRNLEIVENLFSKDKSKTLFGILDNTKTNSGSRLLRHKIISPLIDEVELNKIYDSIDEFNEFVIERDEIRELFDDFYDIERITSRISSKIASPKDLFSLKLSLEKLPKIKNLLNIFQSKKLIELSSFDILDNIRDLLENAISDSAPHHTRDIGYIKSDFNPKLKELFDISSNSKDFISQIEEEERLTTGISTLKIRFNKIFGYFIEIPRSQESKIPQGYYLRQTLANNCRYTTDNLKEKEDLILGAEDGIKILEKKVYEDIIEILNKYIIKFQDISYKISEIDILTSHSYNSQIYNYVRPTFSSGKTEIIDGRNPIVERFCESFIPNDIYFDNTETLKIITGPNMAGKSTYLRQSALISIMAQIGSFIPVKSAKLKIYDRVFTRIGAHDELSEGQSTFMVEMVETANILNNATKNSLVLLDEIGRGTSTYDGLSIAWAITESLAKINCDTIFATHYHQLNKLSNYFSNICNYNVTVLEVGNEIKFIRKIEKGGTDKSYGIYVGKLAGIPNSVLTRALEIQNSIEDGEKIVIDSSKNNLLNKKENNLKNNTKTNNLDKFF